jgi:hypothetical protein
MEGDDDEGEDFDDGDDDDDDVGRKRKAPAKRATGLSLGSWFPPPANDIFSDSRSVKAEKVGNRCISATVLLVDSRTTDWFLLNLITPGPGLYKLTCQ